MMRMRRVLLIAALVAAAATGAVWLASGWLIERGREVIERELGRALNLPVSLPVLKITWVPLTVYVENLSIGPDGAAVRVGSATIHVLIRASLRQLRPVVDVEAARLWVDPARIDEATSGRAHGSHERTPPPLFKIHDVRVTDGTVRLSDPPDRIELTTSRARGTVEIDRWTKRLNLKLNASGTNLDWNGRKLLLDRARARLQDSERGLKLTYAYARGEGLKATARIKGSGELEHVVRAEVDIERLAFINPVFGDFRGEVGVEGRLHGKLDQLNLDAMTTVRGLTVEDRAVGDLQGRLRTSRDHVEFVDGRLQGLGGTALLNGRLAFRDPAPFAVQGTLQGLQLPEVTRLAASISAPPGTTDGRFTLEGTLAPLSLHFDTTGVFAPQQAGAAKPIGWSSTGHYEESGSAVEVSLDQAGVNALRGRASLARDQAVDGEFKLRVDDTGALGSLTGVTDIPAVRGSLNASGRLSGTLQRPLLTATVDGQNVQAAGVLAQKVSGSVSIDPDYLQMQRIVAVLDKGSVEVDGRLGLAAGSENSWQAQIHELPTNTIVNAASAAGIVLPLWGGQLNASVAGSGAWSRISVSGAAEVRDVFLSGEPLETVTAHVEGLWPAWKADVHVEHRPEESLTATLSGKGLDEIALKADASDWDLSRFRGASLKAVAGRAWLEADVSGPPNALSGRIGVRGVGLVWGKRRVGDVRVDISGDRGRWQLDGDVGGLIQLDGTLGQQAGYPFTLAAHWNDADLGPLAGGDPPLEIDSTGRVEIRGRLDDLRLIDGDVDIGTLAVRQGEYHVRAREPIRIHGRGGRFTIDSLALGGHGVDVRLDGSWAMSGELNLRVRAKGDLHFAEVLERVVSARGAVEATADIAHSAAGEWNLAGTITLEDGDADLGLPVAFTDTHARFSLEGRTIRVEHFAGEAGGGTFAIGGKIDVVNGPDLTWEVRQMSTGVVESLEDEVSGRGSVRGGWKDFTIAGEVDITKALYTRKIKVTDLLPSFQRGLKPPPAIEPEAANIHLDVWIRAPGDIFVDNNFAKLELRMNVHVTGTVRDPVLSGPIELIDGTVTVQNRTFQITTGVIDFRPELGLNPTVNIRGETVVNTKESSRTITVEVAGTAQEFRVALGGDDASLTPTDLVSVLATGQTRAEAQAAGTGGVSTGDLVSLAPGLYEGKLQEGLQQFLPLDTIEVEPTLSRSTGTLQPRVSVGKDLTEKLKVALGSTFGVEAFRTAQVRYQLSPRTTLVGLWESATTEQSGAFGGEINFQYRYIGWPRFSLLRPWGVVDVD